MLHITQKHILDSLAQAEFKRYGELKPTDIDGNVFGYHLKQTLAAGLAEKSADGTYRLTESGRNYIINRYHNPLESAHSIFLLVIRCGDNYLIRERKIQPMLGYSGFIHGEPTPGEMIIDTANKRLRTKTGLECSLSVSSSGLITIKKDSGLQSYSHAVILTGEITDRILEIDEDETGRNYWLDVRDLEKSSIIPSCKDILRILENQQQWFELNYDL